MNGKEQKEGLPKYQNFSGDSQQREKEGVQEPKRRATERYTPSPKITTNQKIANARPDRPVEPVAA
jgi:hypothetical protein